MCCFLFCVCAYADISGSVSSTSGTPIASCFIGALTPSWELTKFVLTDPNGKFSVPFSGTEGFIVVQPPAAKNGSGLEIYPFEPRIYHWNAEKSLEFKLPPAGCIVVNAYDRDGKRLRWEDFQKRGVFAGQFMYVTNLREEMVPSAIWPVHDDESRSHGSPREKGLPAAVIAPQAPIAIQVLYWDVPQAGKLLLRADNGGTGFTIDRPGQSISINLNFELARTAVEDFARRPLDEVQRYKLLVAAMQQRISKLSVLEDQSKLASLSDDLLGTVLFMRNDFELALAKSRISNSGATGRTFQFGVFEGSPYNPPAWKLARDSGFSMATVMLGWNWTQKDDGTSDWEGLDRVYGIGALSKLGYDVKAHGVVYMQDYGILPDRAKSMPFDNLKSLLLAHESQLLEYFGGSVALWEAMNEPGLTNVTHFTREQMIDLMASSAQVITGAGKKSLVNSAHESNYGAMFSIYKPDNTPENDYPLTYSGFLQHAKVANGLDSIDVIGLQFYPGFHFNEMFGGQEGPAVPPYWIIDCAERYRALFGKPIHITEFSLPSSYGADWKSGYWKAPWTEAGQAEFAEQVFTMAYGCPAIESITWWDVTDEKPSVITGGLATSGAKPKPALERVSALLKEWQRAGK
jgi:hypothetical protein